MKKSSSLTFISAGILASIVSVVPMTLPAAAQTSSGAGTQGTGTTSTYQESRKDNSNLWGLTGLLGLLGFLGKRKDDRSVSRPSTSRDID